MKNNIYIALLLILLGLATRLLPHPANFAPIAAIALFGGLYLPRKFALIVPLIAVFASDIFIGFYDWKIMMVVYGSFAVTGLIGLYVRGKPAKGGSAYGGSFSTVLLATTLGAIIFYLTTNAAVWLFGTMYPHTLSGLMESYVMAIPFFKNSLLGDLFYVGILVGTMELILVYQGKKKWLGGQVIS